MASSMAAIVRRRGAVALEDVPVPERRVGDRIVDVRRAGICRTDLFVADGMIPVADGLVLGHELSGTVDGRRATVVPILPCGRCAACASLPERCARPTFLGIGAPGAFASRVRVPEPCVREVPGSMSDEEAAFVEPFAAALAVLSAPIRRGARVAVLGRNRIATLVHRIVAHATGREPARLDESGPIEEHSHDVVVETVPTGAALDVAVRALAPGGVLVLKSRPVERAPLDVARVVQKEITLVGVRYAPFGDAIRWIAERRVEIDDLFGPVLPLARWSEALDLARRPAAPKVFFAPEGSV
jgi:threonine dehydrogenase-like Zn-dependent dehydrogenase